MLAETVRKECSALQSLVDWAAREDIGLLTEPVKVPTPRKGATGTRARKRQLVDLTPEQVEIILANLPERLRSGAVCRAYFRVLWETGLRRGNLLRLRAPDDYRRGSSVLRVRKEADKSSFERELPLTEAAREALDSVVPKRGPLFTKADHRKSLRKAARIAGVPEHLVRHIGNHDFRHARTTALLDQGASLTGVGYLVGHKRATTTDGYAHARQSAARKALELSGYHSGHRAEREGRGDGKRKPANLNDSRAFSLSGRLDSNQRPPDPQSVDGVLTPENLLVLLPTKASEDPDSALSGHGVPIIEAAIRFCESVAADDPHAISRGLELAQAVADWANEEDEEDRAGQPRRGRGA